MVKAIINHRNDLMKKMKMEMIVKNCQCYCKKTIEQQFSWSISYQKQERSQNVRLRFVVSLEVRTFWRHSMVDKGIDHGKLFSICCANLFMLKWLWFAWQFSQQTSHLASFWKGGLKVNFLVLVVIWIMDSYRDRWKPECHRFLFLLIIAET